jgi:(4S)-4-hydroxy-5-phosphonooxypentane-2,3-dione isomerase
MHVLLVTFRIRPEHIAAFAEAIATNARSSLEVEAGCQRFDVCRDPKDDSLFVLYEIYDDEAAIEAHVRSAHYQGFDALTARWVLSKAVQRLVLPGS